MKKKRRRYKRGRLSPDQMVIGHGRKTLECKCGRLVISGLEANGVVCHVCLLKHFIETKEAIHG